MDNQNYIDEIKNVILANNGALVDLKSSKLWYLNEDTVLDVFDAYQDIDYTKTMKTDEGITFSAAAAFVAQKYPGSKINLVDWGSADGVVGRLLIEALGTERINTYFPVDIQPKELALVLRRNEGFAYKVEPVVTEFELMHENFPLPEKSNILEFHALLGGTYGNFQPKDINRHIKKVLKNENVKMLVYMPVHDREKQAQEIIDAYSTASISSFFLGLLKGVGFQEDQFKTNLDYGIKTFAYLTGDSLEIKLILDKNVPLFNSVILKGTQFVVGLSRKISAQEFKRDLENDFNIEFFTSGKSSAAAIISKGRGK